MRLTGAFLIAFAFILFVSSCSQQRQLLVEQYDDGSEMNLEIIRDFLSSEECQRRCQRYGKDALMKSFEDYRGKWVEKMVNFVIDEL